MIQLKIMPNWCVLCKESGEFINYLFLHYSITLGLWHYLFRQVRIDWVPPRSICDMMTISFRCLGSSIKGKALWQIVCLTMLWIVWQEENTRIFEKKGRMEEMIWDLLHFYSSLWASCIITLKVLHLKLFNLVSFWRGRGEDNIERNWARFWGDLYIL